MTSGNSDRQSTPLQPCLSPAASCSLAAAARGLPRTDRLKSEDGTPSRRAASAMLQRTRTNSASTVARSSSRHETGRRSPHRSTSSNRSRSQIKARSSDSSNSRRRAIPRPSSRSEPPASFALSFSIRLTRASARSIPRAICDPKLNPSSLETIPALRKAVIQLQKLRLPPTRWTQKRADPPPIADLPVPHPKLANQSVSAVPKTYCGARSVRPDHPRRP